METPLSFFVELFFFFSRWIHSFLSFVGFVVYLFPLTCQNLLLMWTARWLLDFPMLLWICFYISFATSVIMEETGGNIMWLVS